MQTTPAMTCHYRALGLIPEHPLCVHSVSLCGVVYEHVRNCSYQFAVLDNGTSAHPLNYTARRVQQPLIRHTQDHTLVVGRSLLDRFNDFHTVFTPFFTVYR